MIELRMKDKIYCMKFRKEVVSLECGDFIFHSIIQEFKITFAVIWRKSRDTSPL